MLSCSSFTYVLRSSKENGAFPQTFVWRNDISTAQGKKSFFPEGSKNIISSHKSLWKCHSHNKGFLMQKYPFIPVRDFSFFSCKYLHFMCFLENLRTSLRKIYVHGVFRKSLYKIFEQIKEKFRAGINGYFCCIKKIFHFNGNGICISYMYNKRLGYNIFEKYTKEYNLIEISSNKELSTKEP